MNANVAETVGVVFSTEELALLARFAEVTPLFGLEEPDLTEDGWNAVFNGLMARGVIEPRSGEAGEDGVGFADGYAPVLGLALLATRATSLRFGQEEQSQSQSLTFLREPAVAALHQRTPEGLHRFSPIAGEAVVNEVAALVTSAIGDSASAGSSEAVRVPTDAYMRALDVLQADGLPAALEALPAAADFLAAIAAAEGSVTVADWILEDDGSLVGELLSIVGGGGTLWFVDQDETSVVLKPTSLVAALERVAATVN